MEDGDDGGDDVDESQRGEWSQGGDKDDGNGEENAGGGKPGAKKAPHPPCPRVHPALLVARFALYLALALALALAGSVMLHLRQRQQAAQGAASLPPSRLLPGARDCVASPVLPWSALRDDGFCDCGDGSDEPGTSACSGADSATFTCADRLLPLTVPSSRVEDGVCDCCDGSDETAGDRDGGTGAARAPPCPNTCAAEAAARVAALRASARIEADGAAARAAVHEPAGTEAWVALAESVAALEARAAGLQHNFRALHGQLFPPGVDPRAAQQQLASRPGGYQAMQQLQQLRAEAQHAGNALGRQAAMLKMDLGSGHAWLALAGKCALSDPLAEKVVKGGTSNVQVEMSVFVVCPFANVTQVDPADVPWYRYIHGIPTPPEKAAMGKTEDSRNATVATAEAVAGAAEVVIDAAGLDAAVAVLASGEAAALEGSGAQAVAQATFDAAVGNSAAGTTAPAGAALLATGVVEEGLSPEAGAGDGEKKAKKKKKKQKKAKAASSSSLPPPPPPGKRPVVLGHWTAWEVPAAQDAADAAWARDHGGVGLGAAAWLPAVAQAALPPWAGEALGLGHALLAAAARDASTHAWGTLWPLAKAQVAGAAAAAARALLAAAVAFANAAEAAAAQALGLPAPQRGAVSAAAFAGKVRGQVGGAAAVAGAAGSAGTGSSGGGAGADAAGAGAEGNLVAGGSVLDGLLAALPLPHPNGRPRAHARASAADRWAADAAARRAGPAGGGISGRGLGLPGPSRPPTAGLVVALGYPDRGKAERLAGGGSGGVVMRFAHGDGCGGGGNGGVRTVAVGFACGGAGAEQVVSVDEDGPCDYHILLTTPAACSTARAEALEKEAAALDLALARHRP